MQPPRCITGLSWFIDNQILTIPEAEFLRQCATYGWVYLQAPAPILPELLRASDPKRRSELVAHMHEYPIPITTFVLGYSAPDYGFLADETAGDRIDKIHALIWSHSWHDDVKAAESGNKMARSRIGDTLIVEGSVHYAHDLVTFDVHLQKRAKNLAELYPQFKVIHLYEAEAEVRTRIADARKFSMLEPLSQHYADLPAWPPATK